MNNTNDILKEKLDKIFSVVEPTPEVKDLYDEVLMNIKEACADYMESGESQDVAIERTLEDLGDLSELLSELSSTAGPNIMDANLSGVGEQIGSKDTRDSEATNERASSQSAKDNYNTEPFPKVIVGAFMAKRELVNQVAIPMDNIDNVMVLFTYDKVEILPSDNNNFYIIEYMNIRDERLFSKWKIKNNTLIIQSGQRPLVSIGVNGLSTKIEILVPRAYHNKISAKVTSGSLKIEELANLTALTTEATSGSQKISELKAEDIITKGTSGSINLKEVVAKTYKGETTSGTIQHKVVTLNCLKATSTSGSIKIYDTTISEKLDLESTSGSLKISDSNTNEMNLRTNSGSIKGTVSNIKGALKSTSGSIKLATSKLAGNVELTTNSGSASLQLKDEQKFNFKLRYGSGSGKVKLPKTIITSHKKHSIEGFVGEANDIFVNGETLSGSITIKGD